MYWKEESRKDREYTDISRSRSWDQGGMRSVMAKVPLHAVKYCVRPKAPAWPDEGTRTFYDDYEDGEGGGGLTAA